MATVFDNRLGEQLKFDGMAMAAQNNKHVLKLARMIAVEVATGRADRTATADDVGKILLTRYGIPGMGPAAGSLFKNKKWEWTGDFKKSERASNHSRLIRVWRLK
jgi:hypothetical protein